MRQTTLPDGGRVWCVNPAEARALAEQVGYYLQHGVTVSPGDTVFDVGANIGLFGRWVRRQVPDCVVYSFEPIPQIFAALDRNTSGDDHWHVFNVALGASVGVTDFTYHPNGGAFSSAFPLEPEEFRRVAGFILDRNPGEFPNWFRRLPPWTQKLVFEFYIRRMLQTRQISCVIHTVSKVLAEHPVEQVDLLKIDVERAELDVLRGINKDDWPRVRQVVLELHDLDGRLSTVRDLLDQQGFDRITVEQEPVLKGSDVYNLFALRSAG